MHDLTSTITAISTPLGKGGVALIRTSGDAAVEILSRCFRPKNGKPLADCPVRQAIYGEIFSGNARIDDGIAIRYEAPASYTGEDMVELTCHGGVLITRSVLETVLACGALPADAGEFTQRAFLAGKLSLTEAEGIGMLLEAKTHAQMRLSGYDAREKLSAAIGAVHDRLVHIMGTLYAKIDYPDEDLADMDNTAMADALEETIRELRRLAHTYRTGSAITEGIETVICGETNVGKSTLYNLLCGGEYAIVTDIQGTTRDLLSRTASVGRVTLHLFDTAGFRETEDTVEQIGIRLSREKMASAQLILLLLDASRPMTAEDRALLDEASAMHGAKLVLLNKTDRGIAAGWETLSEEFTHVLPIAAAAGDLGELPRVLDQMFTDEEITVGEDAILSSARQYGAVQGALSALERALDGARAGFPADLVSSDIEYALRALSELDGRAVSEDVVADIFRHFCVGK